MGDLIIKPASSGNLKIQDQGGTERISLNTSGVTTFASNTTFSGTGNNIGTATAGTLGSSVVFPAGHIIQVKFVEFTGVQTIGNGSSTGTTFVNIGSGVSGQEFSIDMSLSASGNKVIGFGNVNITSSQRYSGIKVFYDSTQIALGDASSDRTRMTVSTMRNDDASNDQYIMHNSSFSFNYTPSDTSNHTYSVKAGNTWSNSGYTYINRNNDDGDNAYTHRGYSHFTLMEIAQ